MASSSLNNSHSLNENIGVVSYNMHGFKQGILMLKSLCFVDHYDIIFIQEHWLTSDLLSQFDYFKKDYYIFGISAMDSALTTGILRGRPYGGVLTMINKTLRNTFNDIHCVSCTDKYTIVALDKLLLINVYLPCSRNAQDRDELCSIFSRIYGDIEHLNSYYIVLGGDINCNVNQPSETAKLINDFVSKLGLSVCNNFLNTPCLIEYTFAAESRQAYSIIDHFFVSDRSPNHVSSLDVIHDVDNHSDHLPLLMKLERSITDACRSNNSPAVNNISSQNAAPIQTLDWSKSNLALYYELTRVELYTLHCLFGSMPLDELQSSRPDFFSQKGINDIYRNIVHTLLNCSTNSVPYKNKSSAKKFWWDSSLRDAKCDSIKHYKNWVDAGKPKQGHIFNAKSSARKKYKTFIHKKKNEANKLVTEKLQNSLLKTNKNKFWRLWKSNFKQTRNNDDLIVNNLNDNNSVANYLAENFKSACTPNDKNKDIEFRNKYFYRKKTYTGPISEESIDVETVSKAIDHMVCNKAAGFDRLTIEHIKYAHPSLVIILSTLFNIILLCGLVPDDFGVGVTTPIPKFKGNKKSVSSEDFRGITISPVISKIFEYCLLGRLSDLKTSERQFGFKQGIGCNNSIQTVRKVINYFNTRKSTVNIGVIDLKKAFDKVNIYGLLSVLQEKNVNAKLIDILENWFSKGYSTIRWGCAYSECFPLLSGVRQGSILSPLFYSLYADIVLQKLEKSSLGCFVNFTCYNSFMYADDILLLSISVSDLQLMFNLCSDVFTQLDLPINVTKSHCLRVGPRCHAECSALCLQGSVVQWTERTKYLGITLCRAKQFTCCWKEAKGKFYCNINTIFGRLGTSAVSVLLKLMHSQGLPNLLYGTAATTLSATELKSFSYAYNNIFSKIFCSNNNTTILQCQFYSGNLCFDMIYDLQRYTFLHKLITECRLSEKCAIDLPDFRDYLALKSKYQFLTTDSNALLKRKVWNKFDAMIKSL